LRKHVKALTLDIGPRTPFMGDSLARAAAYIHSVFEDGGLCVTEQAYRYYGQRVVNVIATPSTTTRASAYYVVGAHYDTVPTTPGAVDNASAMAVLLELARRLPETKLKAPVALTAFTLEEPPAFMTGHQGSRVFVRDCKSRGDRCAGHGVTR
jgi:Zn-dependent M28 family amino/carboxypeptidase